jgi:3-dehydroquinate synthase
MRELPDKICLYGPPGVGKSLVGQTLAKQLKLPFLDLDNEIVLRAGKSVRDIFDDEGEAGFRTRESAALRAALRGEPAVIALGGGTLLTAESRTFTEAHSLVVCLTSPQETLLTRIQHAEGQRPLLAGDPQTRLSELLVERAGHYASFSTPLDTSAGNPKTNAFLIQIMLGYFHIPGMGDGYDVRVGPGTLNSIGAHLKRLNLSGRIALVTDENVGPFYAGQVAESLEKIGCQVQEVCIPPGEASKTLESATRLWETFLTAGLERGSMVVALGGGVVGDLAGFAAATYLRGVKWVVMPTSLLAMVDASLGGKTGVDLPRGKNLVGAFHPPAAVLTDPDALKTLPAEEFRSGLAEVVKHGVIGDPQLFSLCANGWAAIHSEVDEVVRRAMGVKVRIITQDPYEKGARAALNFGHTIGHALELASDFHLRHGEAVSIGMVMEAQLSEHLGLAERGLVAKISSVLSQLGLPTGMPGNINLETARRAMNVDKKKHAGQVRFALPRQIGDVQVGVGVDDLDIVFKIMDG